MNEPIVDTFACLRLPPELQPAIESEVDTLGTVETQIEASMIAPGKGDDELSRFLDEGVGATGLAGEEMGRSKVRLVSQELWANLGSLREES